MIRTPNKFIHKDMKVRNIQPLLGEISSIDGLKGEEDTLHFYCKLRHVHHRCKLVYLCQELHKKYTSFPPEIVGLFPIPSTSHILGCIQL
ncbi:hypothetical protein Ahy_B04g069118 isoform C [Arachis hypogaea]|uniref:Uncharacterized protein n=1 Tax=Arachis hypogaea TaxID=3818 RepID=A0A444ZBS2_ARAHY|nr:hypothetical protein Ahy_B04g069118 isoform C [Arachis hypogaea]